MPCALEVFGISRVTMYGVSPMDHRWPCMQAENVLRKFYIGGRPCSLVGLTELAWHLAGCSADSVRILS